MRILLSLALWPMLVAAQPPEFTFNLATIAPEGTPWADSLKGFEKRVEAESKGRIDIKLKLGGVLGGENETIAETRRGAIPLWAGSTGALASSVPEISLLELPYLFRDEREADFILDEILFEDYQKLLAKRGFILVFWAENGYRSFGTKFGFVKTPADLKGRKMRSQESQIHIEMYKALGAIPNPISVGEVFTSLQTGVVDGFDNTPLYTFATSWHQTITHFTVSDHIYQPAAIVMSKKALEEKKVPPDLLKVIMGDQRKQAVEGRTPVRALTPLLLENFTRANIHVYRLSPQEKASFAAATARVQDRYIKAVPSAKPLLEKVKKALSERRR